MPTHSASSPVSATPPSSVPAAAAFLASSSSTTPTTTGITKPKKQKNSTSSSTSKPRSSSPRRVDQNVGVKNATLEFDGSFFVPNEQVVKPQFCIFFHCPPTVIIHNILMIIFVGPQKQRRKGSKSFSGALPSWQSEPKLAFAPLNYHQRKEIEKEKVSLQPQNKESHPENLFNFTDVEGMNPIQYAMANCKMRFDIKEISRLKWTSSEEYPLILKDIKANPKIKVPENYAGGNGLSNFSGYVTLVFFFEHRVQNPQDGTFSSIFREQEITFKMATRRNRGDPNVDPKEAEFKYYMCYTSGSFSPKTKKSFFLFFFF